MVLKAKDISLRVEGSELRMKDLTTALRNQTIQAGLKTVELSKLKVLADLKVPPPSGTKWLVFTGIPAGVQIPKMVLRLRLGDKPLEVDVNDAAHQAMRLQVERIGPRGCLALLTISGELNTVNMGSLSSVLESLVAQKVVRVVIRFTGRARRWRVSPQLAPPRG